MKIAHFTKTKFLFGKQILLRSCIKYLIPLQILVLFLQNFSGIMNNDLNNQIENIDLINPKMVIHDLVQQDPIDNLKSPAQISFLFSLPVTSLHTCNNITSSQALRDRFHLKNMRI